MKTQRCLTVKALCTVVAVACVATWRCESAYAGDGDDVFLNNDRQQTVLVFNDGPSEPPANTGNTGGNSSNPNQNTNPNGSNNNNQPPPCNRRPSDGIFGGVANLIGLVLSPPC